MKYRLSIATKQRVDFYLESPFAPFSLYYPKSHFDDLVFIFQEAIPKCLRLTQDPKRPERLSILNLCSNFSPTFSGRLAADARSNQN